MQRPEKHPLPNPLPEGRGDGSVARNGIDSLPLQGEGQGGGAPLEYKGGVNRYASQHATINAKSLRRNMTEAEKLLWYQLRAKRFKHYKFRRQHPLGRYILDFVCLRNKLVVELYGGQHCESVDDRKRDDRLARQGFQVLRFWNHEVMENLEGVLLAILTKLESNPTNERVKQ